MNRFVGKFVGTLLGFMVAGPTGAFFGLVLGHLSDVRNGMMKKAREKAIQRDYFPDFSMSQNQKTIFSLGVIVLGAKLAKADGHVSREEVLAFRRVFRSYNSQLAEVGALFDRARQSSEDYEPYAARLAGAFGAMPDILEEIMVGLFYIAIADNPRLSRPEIFFLRRVAVIFGFTEEDFRRLASRVGIFMTSAPPTPKHDSAYDVLGLPTTATEKDIKKTYRALIRKNHPDLLAANGLSPETLGQATERMKRINAAYSDICKIRGIK